MAELYGIQILEDLKITLLFQKSSNFAGSCRFCIMEGLLPVGLIALVLKLRLYNFSFSLPLSITSEMNIQTFKGHSEANKGGMISRIRSFRYSYLKSMKPYLSDRNFHPFSDTKFLTIFYDFVCFLRFYDSVGEQKMFRKHYEGAPI